MVVVAASGVLANVGAKLGVSVDVTPPPLGIGEASLIPVNSVPALIEAVLLVRLSPKISKPSTMESGRVVTEKFRRRVPADKSVVPVLVAVTVTAWVNGSVVIALSVTPVSALSAPASNGAKSIDSVADTLEESSVTETL